MHTLRPPILATTSFSCTISFFSFRLTAVASAGEWQLSNDRKATRMAWHEGVLWKWLGRWGSVCRCSSSSMPPNSMNRRPTSRSWSTDSSRRHAFRMKAQRGSSPSSRFFWRSVGAPGGAPSPRTSPLLAS